MGIADDAVMIGVFQVESGDGGFFHRRDGVRETGVDNVYSAECEPVLFPGVLREDFLAGLHVLPAAQLPVWFVEQEIALGEAVAHGECRFCLLLNVVVDEF